MNKNLLIIFFLLNVFLYKNNLNNLFFNKKSSFSYIKDSFMVLYPSVFISSSGLISTYLFEKIFKKFFPKKYNKINKNLIKIIYLISALPGIIIFLRSGIWNFFNVFTRTNGYDLYNKNKLKINLKQNSIYSSPIDNSISLTDDEKNTLYIYIHETDTDNNLHLNALKGAFYLDKIENGSYYDLKRDYFYFINRNICEMEYYYNFYYLNWSGILSETERLFVADKLANDLKKNEFAKYKKIVLIGNSYGGSIAINAAYSAIKNNLNKKIEIVTIQSPILNNQIRKIDYLLNEKGSKIISIHSPSDYTAVYDPINFGEGVNDFNYENKFPNNKNLASFMNWKINDFGEIQELNHIGPRYSMNLIKFISNILNNFDQYGGKKTVLLV